MRFSKTPCASIIGAAFRLSLDRWILRCLRRLRGGSARVLLSFIRLFRLRWLGGYLIPRHGPRTVRRGPAVENACQLLRCIGRACRIRPRRQEIARRKPRRQIRAFAKANLLLRHAGAWGFRFAGRRRHPIVRIQNRVRFVGINNLRRFSGSRSSNFRICRKQRHGRRRSFGADRQWDMQNGDA